MARRKQKEWRGAQNDKTKSRDCFLSTKEESYKWMMAHRSIYVSVTKARINGSTLGGRFLQSSEDVVRARHDASML